ncbi:hypothetical protein GCM10027598_82210 [Amycolatopsis oliviviridis]|uniref:CvpA family protein n=1 Tax=Amycolatopsis oliviviridis TaxID=1471590 RepID=A0ABQ3L8K0_9PSEU|nr:hypothetical protein [Amycolatopsis oliviviridis]GHH06570.1 hypothetical protein GCM10017790_12110 [Amycolatopsis oliviviridis]
MESLSYTVIETIPRVLLLVVGLLGLIFSIKGRSRGVSGLLVGAFAIMIVTTLASIVWQFVLSNISSWAGGLDASEIRMILMGVGIPLEALTVLSWLLVAIGVVKSGRSLRQPAPVPYPGQAGYPMAAQPPGFPAPQPGTAQPGQPQPPAQQPPNPQQPPN